MSCSCAFDLNCPNQRTANQNAHALRLGSIVAKQKRRMRKSRCMMTASIWLSLNPPFGFSELSASWLRPWLPTSRVTLHGNFCRATHGWSQEWESARTDLFVASTACSFSLFCARSHVLLQSFVTILGPSGFLQERIAVKQQSRSSGERSLEE